MKGGTKVGEEFGRSKFTTEFIAQGTLEQFGKVKRVAAAEAAGVIGKISGKRGTGLDKVALIEESLEAAEIGERNAKVLERTNWEVEKEKKMTVNCGARPGQARITTYAAVNKLLTPISHMPHICTIEAKRIGTAVCLVFRAGTLSAGWNLTRIF